MKLIHIFFLIVLFSSCTNSEKETTNELESEEIIKVSEPESSMTPVEEEKTFKWNILWDKVDKYRNISSEYSDKAEIPEDFLNFYKKFITDSIFQKEHLSPNELVAVIGACEETIVLDNSNWTFDNWPFIKDIGIDDKWENTFFYSESFFFCEYVLKEVGTIRQIGFEKTKNDWVLTVYFINQC